MAVEVFGKKNKELNLQLLMQELESTLAYYASIPSRKELVYESDYHEIAIDPDGKTRSHLNEREVALSGCNEIVSYLKEHTPGKILDFGCGLGWILSTLNSDWDKFGIEVSKFAADHASNFGSIYRGNYMNYSEKEFDVVVMNHVIEHLPNPEEAIAKVHSILKPKGLLIIGTPNFDSGAARKYGNRFRLLNDPTHISLFSEDSLRRFIRDHGFKIIKAEYPFFDTPWFNAENLLRLLENDGVSPPFYGSFVTIFAKKL